MLSFLLLRDVIFITLKFVFFDLYSIILFQKCVKHPVHLSMLLLIDLIGILMFVFCLVQIGPVEYTD